MNILGTIDRCINMIPKELVEGDILYVELDKTSYDTILNEVENLSKVNGGITLKEERYSDVSKDKAIVIGLSGYKIVVVLNKNKQEGEILDISDSISFTETEKITAGEYKDAKNSDIIILTAGVAQKPGETRLDLVSKNKEITSSIFKLLAKSLILIF